MLNAGPLLEQIMLRESLSQTEAYSLFNSIMHGEQSEVMIASVLTALKMKKESPSEIAGAASAMAVSYTHLTLPTRLMV